MEYINTNQVAKLLGKSECTVRRYIKDGKIPYSRPFGGNYRFKRETILQILDGKKR